GRFIMSYVAVLEQQLPSSQEEIVSFHIPSPVGTWQVAASRKGLQSIQLLDTDAYPEESLQLSPKIQQWKALLTSYLQDGDVAIDRILIDWEALSGTAFQKRCWLILMTIPYGETRSYGWIAEQVGSLSAVRAVGQAIGRNPIPLVIPCHRV